MRRAPLKRLKPSRERCAFRPGSGVNDPAGVLTCVGEPLFGVGETRFCIAEVQKCGASRAPKQTAPVRGSQLRPISFGLPVPIVDGHGSRTRQPKNSSKRTVLIRQEVCQCGMRSLAGSDALQAPMV